MPRRLLVLNAVLGIMSLAFAVGIVRTLLAKHPMPVAPAGRPAPAPQSVAIAVGADSGPEAYGVIAAQNLFKCASASYGFGVFDPGEALGSTGQVATRHRVSVRVGCVPPGPPSM